jgi:hypothetical protein
LAKKLGNMRLSRIKASELNIYARGSVQGVQAHLRELNKSTQDVQDKLMVDALTYKSSTQDLFDNSKPSIDP